LEEHVASIFRVEEQPNQESSIKAGGKQSLFFDHEDVGEMFLQNVSWPSTHYTVLYAEDSTLL
jgi:hypothetical protein